MPSAMAQTIVYANVSALQNRLKSKITTTLKNVVSETATSSDHISKVQAAIDLRFGCFIVPDSTTKLQNNSFDRQFCVEIGLRQDALPESNKKCLQID